MKTYAHFQSDHIFTARQGYITNTLEEAIETIKDDKAADEYVYILDYQELYLLACITVEGEILYPISIDAALRQAEAQKINEEVIRCKDCARFIPEGTHHFDNGAVNKDTCEVIRGFVVQIDPNGFCAWGKRKQREW